MVKIAFFDIDGTLVDMETKIITNTMLEALKTLQKNGIKIIIATGRPPVAIPNFDNIKFDAYMAFNGAYCFNNKEVIFSNPIDHEDVLQIIENGKQIGRPVLLSRLDCNGANGCDPELEEFMAISKQSVDIKENFDEFAKENVYQIMVGVFPHEREALLKDVKNAQLTTWWPKAGDIIPKNGGKGVAVEQILQYFGFTKDEAIAFGDGTNDVEMLEAVGVGVAMENATDDLKKVADVICPHVRKDGVVQYLKSAGLL